MFTNLNRGFAAGSSEFIACDHRILSSQYDLDKGKGLDGQVNIRSPVKGPWLFELLVETTIFSFFPLLLKEVPYSHFHQRYN